MRRFKVAENSMLPTLKPGQEFVTTSSREAAVGDIVALPHPTRDDFWLVKRLRFGPGDHSPTGDLGTDQAWVESDGDGVDSRTFGPVPAGTMMPMVVRLDAATFREGVELLSSEDESLAKALDRFGLPEFWTREPAFETLVLLILEQQVSLESAASVYRKLTELVGSVTHTTIAASSPERLAGIGLTRQKAAYVHQLGVNVAGGILDLETLPGLNPEDARRLLINQHGIGAWTADAFLLSALRFPDIFPVGDRALQVAAMEILGLQTTPDPTGLEMLAEPWRPIRSVAARILWHAYLTRRDRKEPAL